MTTVTDDQSEQTSVKPNAAGTSGRQPEHDGRSGMTETSWVDTYWDLLDTAYWTPRWFGLQSAMSEGRRTYTRSFQHSKEFSPHIRKLEEPFNVIFELTFAILGPDLNAKFFGKLLGADLPPMKLFSRAIKTLYGESATENVMTPDAFLLSTHRESPAILAIENKFNAKTSRDQLAKYLYRMLKEEERSGRDHKLYLLYIFNREPQTALQKGLLGAFKDLAVSDFMSAGKNQKVYGYLRNNLSRAESALGRLNLFAKTWTSFERQLIAFANSLPEGPTASTARNLLMGLATAITAHPHSGVPFCPPVKIAVPERNVSRED